MKKLTKDTILLIAMLITIFGLLFLDAQIGQSQCGDKIYDQTAGKCIDK